MVFGDIVWSEGYWGNMTHVENIRWHKNIVYDWDQRSNLYFFLIVSISGTIISLVAYGLTGKVMVFLVIPVMLGAGAIIFLRLLIVPISVGISPSSLHLKRRIGRRLRTFPWEEISEIRFENVKGDPLMPYQWEIINIHLKSGERAKHGMNVSNEISESIRSACREHNPNIVLRISRSVRKLGWV